MEVLREHLFAWLLDPDQISAYVQTSLLDPVKGQSHLKDLLAALASKIDLEKDYGKAPSFVVDLAEPLVSPDTLKVFSLTSKQQIMLGLSARIVDGISLTLQELESTIPDHITPYVLLSLNKIRNEPSSSTGAILTFHRFVLRYACRYTWPGKSADQLQVHHHYVRTFLSSLNERSDRAIQLMEELGNYSLQIDDYGEALQMFQRCENILSGRDPGFLAADAFCTVDLAKVRKRIGVCRHVLNMASESSGAENAMSSIYKALQSGCYYDDIVMHLESGLVAETIPASLRQYLGEAALDAGSVDVALGIALVNAFQYSAEGADAMMKQLSPRLIVTLRHSADPKHVFACFFSKIERHRLQSASTTADVVSSFVIQFCDAIDTVPLWNELYQRKSKCGPFTADQKHRIDRMGKIAAPVTGDTFSEALLNLAFLKPPLSADSILGELKMLNISPQVSIPYLCSNARLFYDQGLYIEAETAIQAASTIHSSGLYDNPNIGALIRELSEKIKIMQLFNLYEESRGGRNAGVVHNAIVNQFVSPDLVLDVGIFNRFLRVELDNSFQDTKSYLQRRLQLIKGQLPNKALETQTTSLLSAGVLACQAFQIIALIEQSLGCTLGDKSISDDPQSVAHLPQNVLFSIHGCIAEFVTLLATSPEPVVYKVLLDVLVGSGKVDALKILGGLLSGILSRSQPANRKITLENVGVWSSITADPSYTEGWNIAEIQETATKMKAAPPLLESALQQCHPPLMAFVQRLYESVTELKPNDVASFFCLGDLWFGSEQHFQALQQYSSGLMQLSSNFVSMDKLETLWSSKTFRRFIDCCVQLELHYAAVVFTQYLGTTKDYADSFARLQLYATKSWPSGVCWYQKVKRATFEALYDVTLLEWMAYHAKLRGDEKTLDAITKLVSRIPGPNNRDEGVYMALIQQKQRQYLRHFVEMHLRRSSSSHS